MAGDAGFFREQFFPGLQRIAGRSCGPGQPRGVIRRLHGGNPAAHQRVIGAAILRTVQAVMARHGGPEPHGVVMARHHVHLHAKRRDGEIVDHIFAGHDQPDVAPYRHVQFVNFFQPVGLLHFPHPLLADHVDVQRVRGRMPVIDIHLGAPGEHEHRQYQRNHDPCRFQSHVAVDGNTDFIRALALVFEEEINDRGGDRHGKEQADGSNEQHQRVHAGREVGSLLGKHWQLRLHA